MIDSPAYIVAQPHIWRRTPIRIGVSPFESRGTATREWQSIRSVWTTKDVRRRVGQRGRGQRDIAWNFADPYQADRNQASSQEVSQRRRHRQPRLLAQLAGDARVLQGRLLSLHLLVRPHPGCMCWRAASWVLFVYQSIHAAIL
jgi:hypothetical protein